MTERKKGRFNIIDGIVVLVIVVIIAGAVYKFHGLDKTSKNVNMQTVTYQMKIEALRDYVFNNIKVGDTVYDYTSNNAIGTITNIEWDDAVRALYTKDGRTVAAPVENRYDVIITIEAQATENNGMYSVNKVYDLCMNSKREIYTKYIDCTAKITSISAENN